MNPSFVQFQWNGAINKWFNMSNLGMKKKSMINNLLDFKTSYKNAI